MKINIDRLCQLAGVSTGSSTGMLTEASNRSLHDDPHLKDEADWRYGSSQLSETSETYEGEHHEEGLEEDPDEMIEISEAELVQELRRAKRMMKEARAEKNRNIHETRKIERLVDQEVAAMMKEYNITADWVYGDNKPTFSKKGQITTMIPGIGFGKRY